MRDNTECPMYTSSATTTYTRKAPSNHTTPQSVHNVIRHLPSCWQWWASLAVAWLAYTQRPLTSLELLSALVAEREYGSSTADNMDTKSIYDDFDVSRLEAVLCFTLIVSVSGTPILTSQDAKILLPLLTTDIKPILESRIHELIAYTCLQCIQTYQPVRIIGTDGFGMCQRSMFQSRKLQAREVSGWGLAEASSRDLLSYASAHWHTHFRMAERNSRRLASLMYQTIRTGLSARDQELGKELPDSMAASRSGLLICAAHDLPVLAAVYLDMGASFDELSHNGMSPLHLAASKSSVQVLRVGLARQPDLSVVDTTGMAALHHAALRGHLQTVQLLLNAGADINQPTASQESALCLASRACHHDIVTLLLNHESHSPIDYSQRQYNAIEVIHTFEHLTLTDRGSDDRTTSHHRAARSQSPPALHIFIEYG